MILFDTNVLIYAFDHASPFHPWARDTLRDCISGEGAAINPIILAELCVGDAEPSTVPQRLSKLGVHSLPLDATVAPACAEAFALYLENRRKAGGSELAKVPLPDFFIGAHASMLHLTIATADPGRYQTYFPDVPLRLPPRTDF